MSKIKNNSQMQLFDVSKFTAKIMSLIGKEDLVNENFSNDDAFQENEDVLRQIGSQIVSSIQEEPHNDSSLELERRIDK
jgi:hypothetical protein